MPATKQSAEASTKPASQTGRSQLGKTAQIVSIVAGALIAAFAIVYCLGCIYFYDRFWPNTVIGDAVISGMTQEDAVKTVDRASKARTVTVSGQGVTFTLNGASAGLEINAEQAVESAISQNSCWQWPVQLFLDHDESSAATASFDLDLLRSAIEGNIAEFNSIAVEPTDAFLYFDENTGRFEINPGSMGTKLDVDSVMQTIMEALANRSAYAALTSVNLVQQGTKSDDEYLVGARETANSYLQCNLDLTLAGQYVATLGPSVVKDWIVFASDGSVYLDDAQLVGWVDRIESIVDSVGSTRTYTRYDGKYVTVTGGNYGWISDGAALEELVRSAVYGGTVGSSEIPTRQTAATYNPGGADWAGRRYIDVDISEQHVVFYDEWGNILWESDCVTGAYGTHDTPTGVYSIYAKQRDQVLVGQIVPSTGKPEYESPVSFWIPFNDGVGLHDATWQWSFGGTRYMEGAGSHGCINLPYDAADYLYGICEVGDVVVVHY